MNHTLRNLSAIVAVTGACAATLSPAQAQAPLDRTWDSYGTGVYGQPYTQTYTETRTYTPVAAAPRSYSEWAPVISSTPVVERVNQPREQCWTEAVTTHEMRRVAGIQLGLLDTSTNVVVPVTRDVQQCRTIDQPVDVVQGYDVRYRYQGREYVTRTPTDPGNRIRVDVSVLASPQ